MDKDKFRIDKLFPTPLYLCILNNKISTDQLAKTPIKKNIRNHTSATADILKDYPELKKEIEEHLNNYLQQIHSPASSDLRLYITESWLNFTKKGEEHHTHYHPNSFVSGVFYISVNEETDNIEFVNGKQPAMYIQPKEDDSQLEKWHRTSSDCLVGVKNQLLLLFPSTLEHLVPPVKGDQPRISLSFNTFFKGQVSNLNQVYLNL